MKLPASDLPLYWGRVQTLLAAQRNFETHADFSIWWTSQYKGASVLNTRVPQSALDRAIWVMCSGTICVGFFFLFLGVLTKSLLGIQSIL